MTIGTKIIKDSLRETGAFSDALPDDSQAISIGRDRINNMLQLWKSQEIDIPFTPLDAPGDELNEPPDTTLAIIKNLALILAPLQASGKTKVTQQLRDDAERSFQLVRQLYQSFTIPNKIASATLPRGEGNSKGIDRRIFWGQGNEISDDQES